MNDNLTTANDICTISLIPTLVHIKRDGTQLYSLQAIDSNTNEIPRFHLIMVNNNGVLKICTNAKVEYSIQIDVRTIATGKNMTVQIGVQSIDWDLSKNKIIDISLKRPVSDKGYSRKNVYWHVDFKLIDTTTNPSYSVIIIPRVQKNLDIQNSDPIDLFDLNLNTSNVFMNIEEFEKPRPHKKRRIRDSFEVEVNTESVNDNEIESTNMIIEQDNSDAERSINQLITDSLKLIDRFKQLFENYQSNSSCSLKRKREDN